MNRNELILSGIKRVVEFAEENNGCIDFEIDEDLLSTAKINNITIESDDELYETMEQLINEEIINEIIDGAEMLLAL